MKKIVSKKEAIFGILIIALFVATFLFIATKYTAEETKTTQSGFYSGDDSVADRIDVNGKILTIDPITGITVIRLQFAPQGTYLAKDGVSLSKNIDILVNSVKDKPVYNFKKGDIMQSVDVTVELQDTVNTYPFDKHHANFYMQVTAPGAAVAGVDSTDNYESVPVTLNFAAAMNGYNNTAEDVSKDVSAVDANIVINRSIIVVSFAVFIMIIKWGLAMSALLVMLSVVVRKRKVELAMFSWLAALLFALTPLRNAMPNVPPIGSLNDILSFFWAEGIVAISLIVIVFTWLSRSTGEKK